MEQNYPSQGMPKAQSATDKGKTILKKIADHRSRQVAMLNRVRGTNVTPIEHPENDHEGLHPLLDAILHRLEDVERTFEDLQDLV